MNNILKSIQGYKGTILTILALFITYLLDSGSIDTNLAYFFNGSLIALGYTASKATKKIYKK